ncbi:hypothetical protein SteCoe_1785 [Stentor coeruleus]|uniref:Uncharacterized protein n=1 Tax=Stentor coeruleus TaxID=5963 RepID=A0A1R2D100_9CILI|nr:hypothetical protein SteCoe_1785 [Stentor coeruleus]
MRRVQQAHQKPSKDSEFSKPSPMLSNLREPKHQSLQSKKYRPIHRVNNLANTIKDQKSKESLGGTRKITDYSLDELGLSRLKSFTPILASRHEKKNNESRTSEKNSEKSQNSLKNSQIYKEDFNFISRGMNTCKNIVLPQDIFEINLDEKENPGKNKESPKEKIENTEKSQGKTKVFQLTLPVSNVQGKAIYFSPLKNVKKFANLNKTQENPYQNYNLDFNLTETLEEIQRNLILSESSSEEESFSSSSSTEKLECTTKFPILKGKNQVREPSFGVGGGDFLFEEKKVEDHEKIYYEPCSETAEDSDLHIDTDKNIDYKELLSIITNEEFIKSLKVIGKFTKFLEKKQL